MSGIQGFRAKAIPGDPQNFLSKPAIDGAGSDPGGDAPS
jgi:hypothetical protein